MSVRFNSLLRRHLPNCRITEKETGMTVEHREYLGRFISISTEAHSARAATSKKYEGEAYELYHRTKCELLPFVQVEFSQN